MKRENLDGNSVAESQYAYKQSRIDEAYRCFEERATEELTTEILEGDHSGHLSNAICFGFEISEMGEWLAKFYLGYEDRDDIALDLDKKIRESLPDYLVDEQKLLANRIYEMENPEE